MSNTRKARTAPVDDAEFESVHITPEEAPGEVETVVLFTIDDTEYRIPKSPDSRVGLRYLRNARKIGEDLAAAELMIELLGEEGFDALCDYPGIPEDQVEAVMLAAQKLVLGKLEATRGNSGPGSRK